MGKMERKKIEELKKKLEEAKQLKEILKLHASNIDDYMDYLLFNELSSIGEKISSIGDKISSIGDKISSIGEKISWLLGATAVSIGLLLLLVSLVIRFF